MPAPPMPTKCRRLPLHGVTPPTLRARAEPIVKAQGRSPIRGYCSSMKASEGSALAPRVTSELTAGALRPGETQNFFGDAVGSVGACELARGGAHRIESLRRRQQVAHLARQPRRVELIVRDDHRRPSA